MVQAFGQGLELREQLRLDDELRRLPIRTFPAQDIDDCKRDEGEPGHESREGPREISASTDLPARLLPPVQRPILQLPSVYLQAREHVLPASLS